MEQKKPFRIRFCNFCDRTVALLSAIAFVLFALVSLVQTCEIDIGFSEHNSEHVSFHWDSVPLNLLVLAVLLALTFLLFRATFTNKAVYATMIAVSVMTAVIGIWWVLASKAWPGADSLQIVDRAHHIIVGEYEVLRDAPYFYIFPFQLGFLLYTEGMFRLFGDMNLNAMGIANVVFVICAYWAVVKITMRLFDDPKVSLLTAILLGLCMQPTFLCTFLYGTLPGLALACWSLYFVIVSIQEQKALPLVAAAPLVSVAILLKQNYWIFLIAECIVLVISMLRNKRFWLTLPMALMLLLSLLLPRVTQDCYEKRLAADFGEGTPMSAWLVTGFTESSFCSGWFNSYTTTVLDKYGYDQARTKAEIREKLAEQFAMFASRPRYLASFLYHKITSQWNEPAFQSIWSSAAGVRTGEVSALVTSMGNGPVGDGIHAYFNQLMQYVYVGLAIGLILMTRKARRKDERMLIPLILLGAVIYHALFEAKSQYALIYVPLMLPYAAYGYAVLCQSFMKKKERRAQAAESGDGATV